MYKLYVLLYISNINFRYCNCKWIDRHFQHITLVYNRILLLKAYIDLNYYLRFVSLVHLTFYLYVKFIGKQCRYTQSININIKSFFSLSIYLFSLQYIFSFCFVCCCCCFFFFFGKRVSNVQIAQMTLTLWCFCELILLLLLIIVVWNVFYWNIGINFPWFGVDIEKLILTIVYYGFWVISRLIHILFYFCSSIDLHIYLIIILWI